MANCDAYQFNKKARPIAMNTRITWADYDRMHTQSLGATRGRKWIPAWALNDFQMRHVLAQKCWWYAHFYGGHSDLLRVPDKFINDRVALAKMVDDLVPMIKLEVRKLNPVQARLRDCHLDWRMRYGYLDFYCAVAYRAYRLEENSTQIGQALGVSPGCVRVQLERLNHAAQFLGYETHVPHWTKGTISPRLKRGLCWDITEAIAMRMLGFSFSAIGVRMGLSTDSVMRIFSSWGIVVPVFRPAPVKRSCNLAKKIDVCRAAQLRATGMTWKQVAAALGSGNEKSVQHAVKVAGLWVPVRKKKALPARPESGGQPSQQEEKYAYA